MKNLVSRIVIIVSSIVAVAVIAGLLISYSSVVGTRLYDDAKQNFSEVYQQVDSNFLAFMDDTWKNLSDWGPYVHDLDDKSAADYIEQRRHVWEFTSFYFVNENCDAMKINGEVHHLDLEVELGKLFDEHVSIMAEQGLDTPVPITIFASPTEDGTFKGFDYQAIAITYTNEDLANTIKTDAFSGQAMGFVVYPDGTIALTTQEGGNIFSNYLTYLSAGSDLTRSQIDELRSAWEAGDSGVQIFTMNDVEYYIAYQPLGYEDYILMGVIPSKAVSGAVRGVQEMTVDMLLKVFAVVFLLAGILIVIYMRHRTKKSKVEIEYRDVLFSLLSENLDDIFVVVDVSDYHVSYITPNVDRLLGISVDEAQSDLTVLLKGVSGKDASVDRKVLSSIKPGERIELTQEWINQRDGSRRWFKVAIYHMDIQGVEKLIFILSDRTDDRKMAQSLEEALETAKKANLAKSQFLSSMSHDIRTPMNSIMGFTELLEANVENPDRVREYLGKISASSRHLLSLINDVLDMSKIESGKTELNNEEFSFSQLLEEVYAIMATQAQVKGQTFDMSVSGEPAEHMIGDKLRVNQILINLLSNAVKYTQSGGTVEFMIESLPSKNPSIDNVRFVIKDNGMGMSEDYLKVIFEPFTREVSSLTNSIQGTGLGMAITKNLVDLMGGMIAVESKLGEGSKFTVDLSFASVDSKDEAATSKATEAVLQDDDVLKGLHILAAEDNEMSAELLGEFLDMEGATVERVKNGQEAVDAFVSSAPGHFDLILMDVQMPIMGGYDATRAIRASDHPEAKAIPIFAMTANVFAEDVRDALEAGMTAHIPKPLDMNELKRAAESALAREERTNDRTIR